MVDKVCSPLFRPISDLESPLISAEAAALALNMIAVDLGREDEATAIVYLIDMIRTT